MMSSQSCREEKFLIRTAPATPTASRMAWSRVSLSVVSTSNIVKSDELLPLMSS